MKLMFFSFFAIASMIAFNANRVIAQDGLADAATLKALAIPSDDEGIAGAGPIRRYDWFQSLWMARRSQWLTEQKEKQGAVVFLGDSITQGWGDDMHSVFGDALIANRGISGDTTRGMLLRLEQDVLQLNPSGIIMLMGTNDLEEGAEPQTIADNIALIVQRIHSHNSKTPIVLCLVFPSSESKKRPTEKIKEINRLYQSIVKGNDLVTVVDTWTLFANDKGDAKFEEFPDLLHPNALGYKKWENALRPVLEYISLLQAPEESFKLEPGFEMLFNGIDLTGWGLRPTTEADRKGREGWLKSDPNAPAWPLVDQAVSFDRKQRSDDGRYVASNNRLIVTIPSDGRRIQQLWTTKDFDSDFILKLDFRATPNADSGIFVRGKQLQCRDFNLAGPYKELKQYKAQQWNEVEILVKANVARYVCNGEVLEEAFEVPVSGPIGLEGDRGQIEYRNIRIQLTK